MQKLTIQQAFEVALVQHQAGRLREAESLYRQILARDPLHADSLQLLGMIAYQIGQADKAIEMIRRAIEIEPKAAVYHNNLGIVLRGQGKLEESLHCYQRALALKPDYQEAHNNLGTAMKNLGHFKEALDAYGRSLALQPTALTHNNIGSVLQEMGQLDEAAEAFRLAMSLEPANPRYHSNLVYSLCFHPGYSQNQLLAEHRQWADRHAKPLAGFIAPHENDRDPDRRLRVGYVSPDFRNHVVGHNLLPLLSHHDHARFEIFCYSHSHQNDQITQKLRAHANQWRSIIGIPDDATAQMIRSDRIDLLIDLSLHMANNRMTLFARKPAPVQLTYLGYCGTSGLQSMDYRLSDPYLDPPEGDLSGYSERTVRLPKTYWCYQPGGPESPPPAKAPPVQTAGHITFGCLNNYAKVSAAALDLWAKVLLAVPGSRLILHAKLGAHREQALKRLSQGGIPADRVEFVGHLPWPEYMKTYDRIDIALDPFPYGGGITTCDSLWMGTPVVSLSGKTAVGRGGRSILNNVSLPELVAGAPEEYIDIAAKLAGDLPKLAELRSRLRSRLQSSPLMDAVAFARDVESVYRSVWRNWCESTSRT